MAQGKAFIRLLETGLEATLTDRGWKSSDREAEARLNAEFPVRGHGGADPNPMATTAKLAALYFPGVVVALPKTEPTQPWMVY